MSIKRKQAWNDPNSTYNTEEFKNKNFGERCDISMSKNPNWKGGYYLNDIPQYDSFIKLNVFEKIRRNTKDNNILEVKCCYCDSWYIPKWRIVNERIRWFEGKNKNEVRFYCSDKCKNECPIYRQKYYIKGYEIIKPYPYNWNNIRNKIKERDNYRCLNPNCVNEEISTFNITVHHIDYNKNNCEYDNLITLCRSCNSKANYNKKDKMILYKMILYNKYGI